MSQANYIIICKGRINVLSTKDPVEQIRYASSCAADLVSHIEATHPEGLPREDAKAISELQHYMMDHLHSMSKNEASAKVQQMFQLLDALEQKIGSAS